ncbi:MAG: xylan 1,4-beta-xylosidase [Ruminococcus sp.]|nr:xylan 1,4-beta-xylosidase [Ruminococcus sp.]
MLSEQRISNSTYVTLVDTVTGVTYVSVTHTLDSSTIMQPLLDRDGKPYIDPRYGGR